jgi:hypothetical protein
MAKTQHVELTPALRKKIDDAVRSVKGSAAVEGMIEQRLTWCHVKGEARYDAYQRWILSDHHVVFISLNTLHASRSEKPISKVSPAYRRWLSKQARAAEKAAKLSKEEKAEGVKQMRAGKSAEEAVETVMENRKGQQTKKAVVKKSEPVESK